MKRFNPGIAVAAALLAAGCAPHTKRASYADIPREALAGVDDPVPATLPLASASDANSSMAEAAGSHREISRGSGRFIQPQALKTPRDAVAGEGAVTLNFEDQPVEAVVKAILGDLLDSIVGICGAEHHGQRLVVFPQLFDGLHAIPPGWHAHVHDHQIETTTVLANERVARP